MTQNEKDLLLKDLCARLPYGVVVGTTDNDGTIPNFWSLDTYNRLTEDVTLTNCEVDADRLTNFCDVRPYLFPLSSMTEKQKKELDKYFDMDTKSLLDGYKNGLRCPHTYFIVQDWYNKNHFDYRGLIPMGLANDATGLNIY